MLPFEPAFDVVISQLTHYSRYVGHAQRGEGCRPGGSIVVMDSPMFSHAADGRAMVDAQRHAFTAHYGVTDVVRPGVGFLTFRDLDRLADELGLRLTFPSRGPMGWRLLAMWRLQLRRRPAAFGGGSTSLAPICRRRREATASTVRPVAGGGSLKEPWSLVDGNLVDPAREIIARLSAVVPVSNRSWRLPCRTAAQQAVPVCERFAQPPQPIVWGGYFPTQHTDTVLQSTCVDFVVRSQGEQPLLHLLEALRSARPLEAVGSLSWKDSRGKVIHNASGVMTTLDEWPDLPYVRVPMHEYIHSTYLGTRTVAHNSSFGCPFACSFCAVVAMTNRRWLAQSASRMERIVRHLTAEYGVDAVMMHDMDFFISEARVAEFSERIAALRISWWALGRIDTLMHYSDATWRAMTRSGLKMAFSGAESASDEVLATMTKGGQASAREFELPRRGRAMGSCLSIRSSRTPPDPWVTWRGRSNSFARSNA
jgi:hypothetical protein